MADIFRSSFQMSTKREVETAGEILFIEPLSYVVIEMIGKRFVSVHISSNSNQYLRSEPFRLTKLLKMCRLISFYEPVSSVID